MIIIDGGNAMFLNNDKKDARKPGDYFSEDLTPEESAEALKRSVDSIGTYILEFIKSLRRKMTFEEYLKETSDYIDELIIKTVQSELCIKEYKQLKHEEYLEMLRLEKLRRQCEAVAPILPRVVYDLILRNGSIDCQDAVDMCQRDERIKRNDEYIRCQLSSDVKQVLNELSDCGKIGKVYIGNMYIYKNISDEGTHMSSVNIELSVE